MNPKHTPGPWELSPAPQPHDAHTVNGNGKLIAITHCKDPSIINKEEEANSNLIAAAPEMYAALQVVCLDPKIAGWLKENDPQALKQAQSAVAKAEGKTVQEITLEEMAGKTVKSIDYTSVPGTFEDETCVVVEFTDDTKHTFVLKMHD